ncbi:thioesterase II family protein [Streptomyces sp. TLI_171]|uniref:thioesterase II family protein n=1 Tax=Streptomyces sp. TLI_171 TaxID=1938859 RepID=UPI000C69CBA4|nr:alpha/beta fold hydrolase [Streptomyces sp. TLI_171]RKE21268.1 surfactin synthase thioesterase subunit [Streptomyces sp. TLI_171]
MRTNEPPRLICFHHAGAGISAFARWQSVIGSAAEVVPVLLPGRGLRAREQRITDPDRLIAELDSVITPLMDRPVALYGHSLGGLVAYTYAAALQRNGRHRPELVVVGAVLPPHLRSPILAAADLPDDELLPWLVEYGVLPASALEPAETGLWRRRVLPALRDDLRLGEALCAAGGAELDGRLLAVSGTRDPIAPLAGVAQWGRYAPSGFELRTVPGGHFFVREPAAPTLLAEVLNSLRAVPRLVSSAA